MKRVFKCAMEGDERRSRSVKRSRLGMPKCTPNKYSRRLKRLSLGMPPRHPPSLSTITGLSFVALYFYHFMRYVLCLERLALYFLVCFSFACWSYLVGYNPCVGERHAPLELELLIGFACFFFLL